VFGKVKRDCGGLFCGRSLWRGDHIKECLREPSRRARKGEGRIGPETGFRLHDLTD
jgi:hypothetical protein